MYLNNLNINIAIILTSSSFLSDLVSSSVISPSSGDDGGLSFNSFSVFKFKVIPSIEHSKLFKYIYVFKITQELHNLV